MDIMGVVILVRYKIVIKINMEVNILTSLLHLLSTEEKLLSLDIEVLQALCKIVLRCHEENVSEWSIASLLRVPSYCELNATGADSNPDKLIKVWATGYWNYLVVASDIIEYHFVEDEWKRGVKMITQHIMELCTADEDSENTYKVVGVAFTLMENVLNLCQHVIPYSFSSTHQPYAWLCKDVLTPFTKKLEEWLSWLHTKGNTTGNKPVFQQITNLVDWLKITMSISLEFGDISEPIISVLLNMLHLQIQKIMELSCETINVHFWYKAISSLHCLNDKLNELSLENNIKYLVLRLKQWVWQCYNTLIEQVETYHTQLCLSTLLHDITLFQRQRISFPVQMWYFYLHCLKHDLWSTVPPRIAVRILTGVLENSLQSLSSHFMSILPLKGDMLQYQTNILSVLMTVSSLLIFITDPSQDQKETIHQICSALLYSLALFTSPLDVLKKAPETRKADKQLSWQTYLPLEKFHLMSVCRNDIFDNILAVICLPFSNNHYILKILLEAKEGRFMAELARTKPHLFPAIANLLVHCQEQTLVSFFIDCNVSIHSNNDISVTAFTWLRNFILPFIKKLLIDSAIDYTVAANKKDTPSMVAVIPMFLDALPSIFKNMSTSLLLLLQYFAGKVPSTLDKGIMDIQFLFGHLFIGVLSLEKSCINSFEQPLEVAYHWNTFALIITSIFPPYQISTATTLPTSEAMLLDKQRIRMQLVNLYQMLKRSIPPAVKNCMTSSQKIDDTLLKITSDSIATTIHGWTSFKEIEDWMKENKDEVFEMILGESIPLFLTQYDKFDPVIVCTQLGCGNFSELFDVQWNWPDILQCEPPKVASNLVKLVLQRKDVLFEDSDQDWNNRIIFIKNLSV